ncbi:MAG: lysine--tRNA ligase [Candidatus Aenigmatarchaeota archaeon]
MENKYIYWTDRIAEEVRKRLENFPILKKTVEEKGAVIVYDEKTPSGKIHVGSARGWIIHDIITKSLNDNGIRAKFILSSDDMDPLDTVPIYLDKQRFQPFLGIPLRNVPSPNKNYDSYADYFFFSCVERFEELGIEAEIERTGDRYKRGDFNWAIKKVLDNAEKIHEIYRKVYGKTLREKLPFSPICEKCERIGTTLAYEWDAENEILKYVCKKDLVKWAEGCGYEGEISPYNGSGKLPWKVEWAAKWPTVGVIIETAGKDHFTKGGAREIAVLISTKIFEYPPPWPSSPEKIGKGYEFFLVEGKKMSTSKGIGVAFTEILDFIQPEILRFLMVKTRPESAIDFKEEHIPRFYEEFERYERIYFGVEKASEREEVNARRVYELSCIRIPKERPFRIPFEFACILSQILPKKDREEKAMEILKKNYRREFSSFEKELIEKTLRYAEVWTREFAPERLRIKILEELREEELNELSVEQKNSLFELSRFLEKEREETEIWDKIREISENLKIDVGKIFEAAYIVLLGKKFGPRLIPLIQTLERDFVIKRFRLEE